MYSIDFVQTVTRQHIYFVSFCLEIYVGTRITLKIGLLVNMLSKNSREIAYAAHILRVEKVQ